MMKYIIIIVFILLPGFVGAQGGQRMDDEKWEATKVAFLTTKLDLTANEAKVFWPIYNDFTREQRSLRKERHQKMISFRKIKEIDDLSDTEIQALITNDFEFKQKDLNIEKKYYNNFKNSLSIKIVGKFYRAQEAFKKEILSQYRSGSAQRKN